MPPYAVSQALGQARLVDIVRTRGETGKQLAEDSLDWYIECGEGHEILVTDAHLISSSHLNKALEISTLEEIENIDAIGEKLVVRAVHSMFCHTHRRVNKCSHFGCWRILRLRFTEMRKDRSWWPV